MKIEEILSRNIRALRKKKGLSQEGLAEMSGLHRTYISQVECCKRNPSLSSISKIAICLEVNEATLLSERHESE